MKSYNVTIQSIKREYTKLNNLLFGGTLPKAKEINFVCKKLDSDTFASCSVKDEEIYITMERKYITKNLFRKILAHEMVHLYQAIKYNKMDHGKTFFEMKDMFDYCGIYLAECYSIFDSDYYDDID